MKKEFTVSVIISLAFLLSGFLLLHFELLSYGVTIFILLPFVLGYVAGKATFKSISFASLLTSLVFFFILLLTTELEGIVCILMALPLIIIAVALGAGLSYLINRKKRKAEKKILLKAPYSLLSFFYALLF